MRVVIKLLRKLSCTCLLFIVLNFVSKPIFSQLSKKSEISLLTIGQGGELYSAFGHSALYVSDPELNIDDVYNYGTFSFGPDFYLKFTKGEMDYMLSVAPFDEEFYYWTDIEDRSVVKQILDLTLDQKNQLYNYLVNNSLPENRIYRYDYFYDNCSNRIDKALKNVLGDNLQFSADRVVEQNNRKGATIRDLTHHYLSENPWGELGIETCLGIAMDKKITPEQFKFIPDYLMWNFDVAKIKSQGGVAPLVKEKIFLYKSNGVPIERSFEEYLNPKLIFCIVLLIVVFISLPMFQKTIIARIVDFGLFFICGTVGLLLIYLWFFTTHRSQYNLNLIWANPLNFFLSFFTLNKKYNHKLACYFLIYGLILLLTIICWFILPQHLNNAYVFICLALSIRCLTNYWYMKKIKHV